jgi:putative flavoprotein involved in K+ transport
MEINFWGSTEVIGAEYDSADASWTIRAEREGKNIELRAKHLVLATGVSGRPYEPIFSGMANFKGEQHHSSKHPGPHAYIGKNALVVGSSNSAHDIAQALWEVGANVTLVQRSSTLVVKQSSLMEFGLKRLYSEDALSAGINVETADMMNASIPYALIPDFHRPTNRAIQQKDEVFYKDLSKVGFQVSWGANNNTGVFSHYLSRGAGYYIDIGASDLIINGSIKLKSQVDIAEIGEKYVRFSDGSELSADLIVYATGYTPMQGLIVELLGREVAEKVGQVWGLGSGMRGDPGPWEGELRNMWKPTRQSALWFHGGNLAQSRFYSQFLALQLKARFEGIAIPVFGVQEVEPITLSR